MKVCAGKHYRRLSIICLLLFFSCFCQAQIEVSTGIDVNFPLLFNSYNSSWNYNQLGFGLRAGIAYKPAETQFFPMLNLSIGRTRLPLKDLGKNVAALNLNYLNLMLNENIVLHFTQSELYVYGGIGFSHLARKGGIKITGNGGEGMESLIDSIKNESSMFPAVNIGFEYNYGESAGKDLYLTLGINVQYIMLLTERNEFFFTIKQPGSIVNHYNASLTGGAICPGFYIAIHYMLPFLNKKG
jgi:hypothetical protein